MSTSTRTSITGLEHNLRLYNWIKVLTKRVYIPLTAIYLVDVGHVTIAQIGLLATISGVCSILADIPTGYFADRVKRKTSLLIGGYLVTLSSLIYVVTPRFPGAVCATVAVSFGFSFISGAGEALMHDTLAALGKVEGYVKIMGRAQSFGLVGNIILISLIPLTYTLDKRLPFACGAAAALAFIRVATSLQEPERKRINPTAGVIRSLTAHLRTFINRFTIWIFLAIGLLSACYVVYASFLTLVLRDLGVNPSLLGLLFAASSVVGAIGGWYVHHIHKVSLYRYALFDTAIAAGTLVAIGLSHNVVVAMVVFIFNLGFWRLRNIIYQDQLLRAFGHSGNKATLISSLSFFDNANQAWLPYIFVAATNSLGFYRGFSLLGSALFAILAIIFSAAVYLLKLRPVAA